MPADTATHCQDRHNIQVTLSGRAFLPMLDGRAACLRRRMQTPPLFLLFSRLPLPLDNITGSASQPD